jgi:hypothetical protein
MPAARIQASKVLPAKSRWLSWTPSPSNNTVTEIWRADSLTTPFYLVGVTNGNTWPIPDGRLSFWDIRARDTNTLAVSQFVARPWALEDRLKITQ